MEVRAQRMEVGAQRVAGEVLAVIPLVQRRVAADLRKSDPSMKLAHVALLGMVAQCPHSLSELSDLHAASMPTMSLPSLSHCSPSAPSNSSVEKRNATAQVSPTASLTSISISLVSLTLFSRLPPYSSLR